MAHEEYKLAHDDETAVEHETHSCDKHGWQLEESMDDIIKLKPLEDRIIIDTSETAWQMSRLLIKDPTRIEDPEIAERAKAGMVRFNSRHSNNGRTDGRNETGIPIGECFASFEIPFTDPSNPLQPN